MELLDAVRAAEEKADGIRREAAEQARETIKAAEEALLAQEREASAALRADYQARMKAREAAVTDTVAGQAAEKRRELEAYAQAARARMPQAVEWIAERVLQHGNR